MITIRAICKGFIKSLQYPSNFWRWPLVLLTRLPIFLLFTFLRWLADLIEMAGDYIPAVKTSEEN